MQSGVFILFMWWYKMYQHKGNMYFKSVLNMKYIAVLQAWNFRCIPQQWGQQSFRGDYCQAPFLCHLEKLNGKICGEPIIIRIPIKGGMTIQLTEGMCVWGNGAWQELPVENCRCKSSSLNRPCLQWQRLTDGSIVNDCKCSIPLTVAGGIHHLLFDPTCRKRGSLQGRKMSAELMTWHHCPGVLTRRSILCLVRLYRREVLQIKITVPLLTSMSWIRSLFGFVTRHWNPRWSKLMSSNSDQYQWNKYQSASNQNLPQVSSIFATGKKHLEHHLGSPFSSRHLRL